MINYIILALSSISFIGSIITFIYYHATAAEYILRSVVQEEFSDFDGDLAGKVRAGIAKGIKKYQKLGKIWLVATVVSFLVMSSSFIFAVVDIYR